MEKRIVKLLYRSLDAPLKRKDRERLERALTASGELRQLQSDILGLRRDIARATQSGFGPGFAGRVINRIRSEEKRASGMESLLASSWPLFRRLTAVALVMLAVLILYNIVYSDFLQKDQMFYVSNLTIGKILHVPVF